jgi:hypothetical protein
MDIASLSHEEAGDTGGGSLGSPMWSRILFTSEELVMLLFQTVSVKPDLAVR